MVVDYKIEAINILLDEGAILSRYFPLIKYKEIVVKNLKERNIRMKSECSLLNDEELMNLGLENIDNVNLFKRFLQLYDVDDKKIKALSKLTLSREEKESYQELFLLPGVKETRANLYYLSGIKTLVNLASLNENDIINKTKECIRKNNLILSVPLPKEVRTHIAVAKAITAK